jgi:hypothetical protein
MLLRAPVVDRPAELFRTLAVRETPARAAVGAPGAARRDVEVA